MLNELRELVHYEDPKTIGEFIDNRLAELGYTWISTWIELPSMAVSRLQHSDGRTVYFAYDLTLETPLMAWARFEGQTTFPPVAEYIASKLDTGKD